MKRINHSLTFTLAIFSALLAVLGLSSPLQASQVELDSQQVMLLAEGEEDPSDSDGDGIPDEEDPDIDGDGIPNEEDPTPEGEEDPENGDDSDG